jgi:Fe-S oxidoreductase
MRWLYRLYTRDITAQDLRDFQELVYDSCTECGRCGVVCPMGINIASIVNTSRQALAQAGLIPDDLRAVGQEQCMRGTVFGAGPDMLHQVLDELRAEGLDTPLDKDKAEVLVLTSTVDLQLFKDQLRSTIRILNHLGEDWTIRSSAFEGANFGLLSGHEPLQGHASNAVVKEALAIGAKLVIVPECGHAYPALRWEGANQYGRRLPFEVMALSEYLGRKVIAGKLKLKPLPPGHQVTYHDPCKIGRAGGVLEEPRAVLKALGVDLHEMASHGVTNWCCGGGAGVFVINRAAPLRQAAFKIKMDQVNATGAEAVVTACGSCRLNFLAGAQQAGWNKGIESLVELVGQQLAAND